MKNQHDTVLMKNMKFNNHTVNNNIILYLSSIIFYSCSFYFSFLIVLLHYFCFSQLCFTYFFHAFHHLCIIYYNFICVSLYTKTSFIKYVHKKYSDYCKDMYSLSEIINRVRTLTRKKLDPFPDINRKGF